jgi:hypothetical protein
MGREERITLVVAFASPASVDQLAPTFERLFAKPRGSLHLIIGIDR